MHALKRRAVTTASLITAKERLINNTVALGLFRFVSAETFTTWDGQYPNIDTYSPRCTPRDVHDKSSAETGCEYAEVRQGACGMLQVAE